MLSVQELSPSLRAEERRVAAEIAAAAMRVGADLDAEPHIVSLPQLVVQSAGLQSGLSPCPHLHGTSLTRRCSKLTLHVCAAAHRPGI